MKLPRWIPVSESLHKECQTVLVTVWEDCSYGKGTYIQTHVDIGTFSTESGYVPVENISPSRCGYFDTANDWLEGQPCAVTVWMPLPEPYSNKEVNDGQPI